MLFLLIYCFVVNYVKDYTILEPLSSIQCIPVPNADQKIKLDNNGEPLIVSFTNTYDSILLAIDGNAPVTCSQLIVYYPENGNYSDINKLHDTIYILQVNPLSYST